ncbi:MAG: LAGLIDADG family homing endonuclease, partial [Candidatus Hodarchaeales archaeon]
EARRPGIFRSDIFTKYQIDQQALNEIKEIVRQIIIKYSNNTAKKEIKNEFDRKILAKFGDLSLIYSEDIDELQSNFNGVMIKNGVNSSTLEEKNSQFRQILEEISTIYVKDVDKAIEETLKQIDNLIATKGLVQLRGVHVDVTSMYPSQIRQYKLQPSGIVPLSKCYECKYAEKDGSCYFEGDWVIKLTGRRPCRFRGEGSRVCENKNCTPKDESICENYEPEQGTTGRIQEIFTFDGKSMQAYVLKKKKGLVKIPINKSYLSTMSNHDVYAEVKNWLEKAVEATQITCNLDKNHFDTFEDQPDQFKLPPNTFLSLDVRTKKITVLISVYSRVCQKAFNFVSRIMDDFFNTRVKHKFEAQRLNQIIKQKTKQNQPVHSDMLRQQRFHDSTQLGMKVPLNSIYGLLGMKAGVRNASAPCAGITTKLSADLISWAADQLEKIGMVTELDSLDYGERLVLKDPEGFIRVISIGEFTDYSLSINEIESLDASRGVEYIDVPKNWQALSVSEFGVVEWNPILKCIRQKTDRKIFKITTPFGSVKTTDSHAIFYQSEDRLEPIEVKNLVDEFIVHVSTIPNIQKSEQNINFSACIPQDLNLFIYIPTGGKKEWRGRVSSLRYDKNNKTKRKNYYRIPLTRFDGEIEPSFLVGARKGYKYPATIKLDEQIAELCGWFVAEGSSGVYNEKISVGIAQKNEQNLKRIQELIENVSKHLHTQFKVVPSLSDSESMTFRLAMDNVFFYHLFETLGCGHSAFEKRIPKIILSAENKVKEAFLKGYFEGDGAKQGKRKTFWTSSSGLRDDLFVIGKQLGYFVSIQETMSSTSGKPNYIVNFMDKENWKIG